MSHVFISYSHTDFEFVENLKQRLESAGFDTWMDDERLNAGEDWREEIDVAITNSFAVVFVLTPNALESRYVTYEWSFAWGAGKKVIPLLLIQVEDNKLHPRLDRRQHFDFTTRKGRPWEQLFQRLKQIESQVDSSVQSSRAVRSHMIESLSNPDTQIREFSAKTLGSAGNVDAIEMLAKTALHDKEFMVRASAVEALGKIESNKVVPILIEASRDDVGSVRHRAVSALGEIGDKSAIPALRRSLYDTDDLVRAYAAKALGKMQDTESAREIIKTALSDQSAYVRGHGIEALGKIGDESSVSALIEHLQDNEEWYSNQRICEQAAKSLVRIGTPDALSAVAEWRSKQQNQP